MSVPKTHLETRPFVEVQNFDTVTIPPWGAMRCNGTTTLGGAVIRKVFQPSTTLSRDYLINGPAEIPANGFGKGYYGDCIMAACDYAAAVGDGVGFKPSQSTLSKGFPGARVVDLIDSTNNFAWVTLEPITQLYGQATGAISAAGMGTGNKYKIFTGTLGSEADGGWTTVPDVFNRGTAIVTNDYVWLSWTNSGWYIGKIC